MIREWIIKKLYYSLPLHRQMKVRCKLKEPSIDDIFEDAWGELSE